MSLFGVFFVGTELILKKKTHLEYYYSKTNLYKSKYLKYTIKKCNIYPKIYMEL